MTAPPIVLATDFGLADAYVGMMRGVMHGINPAAHVIDLTHGIGPQDVRHGAVVLADSHRYFPEQSIFVVVVDPGVGTDRDAILLETPVACFVAPDNGLLTLVCRQYDPSFGDAKAPARPLVPNNCQAWRLTNPNYWRHLVSNTFHGRDVFAPIAAHLSLGMAPCDLGEPASDIAALALPIPRPDGNTVRGQVIFADAFGNLVTDITADILDHIGAIAGNPSVSVTIAGHTITGLSRTFHDPPGNGLRALIGSHGRLEIALTDGSASRMLDVAAGTQIVIAQNGGSSHP